MKRSVLFFVFAALTLGLLVSACSSSVQPSGIHVALAAVEPGADAATAKVTLQFVNESVYALGVLKSTHRLYLNGTYAGRVEDAPPVGVPPMATSPQSVMLRLENPAFVRQLAGSADAAAVSYRIESVLFETIGEDDYKVKSQFTGNIDLRPLAEK